MLLSVSHCHQPSPASQSVTSSVSHTATTPPLRNGQVKRDCSDIQKQFLHQVLLCQAPRRHWNSHWCLCTSQTETGINLQQLLTPMNRNYNLLTNYHNLKTSEIIQVRAVRRSQDCQSSQKGFATHRNSHFPSCYVANTAMVTSPPQITYRFSLQAEGFFCWVLHLVVGGWLIVLVFFF